MAVSTLDVPVTDRIGVRRALLSVYDKTGLVPLAEALAERGVSLVSTGGTARALREAGLVVWDVSDVTGFPEIMDGRVKTLHPAVHGGLLAVRGLKDHADAMEAHGIAPFELVVCNLYPFAQVARGGGSYAECVENIDIGGPAMIRAAAKNHASVSVLTDPGQYDALVETLDGRVPYALRRRLAQAAFAHVAAYDAAVSNWMAEAVGVDAPPHRAFAGRLAQTMRYGENPHQRAALYLDGTARPGAATAEQVQGKALSFNNVADTDAAFELAAELSEPAIVIVKHANPCGVATADTLVEAHALALRCDPVSAFGGIVAANRPLDEAAARAIAAVFTEVVIAPDADEEARAVFAGKPNLRLLLAGAVPDPREGGMVAKPVAGGFLLQDRDAAVVDDAELRVVSKRAPTEAEMADMRFAFRVAKHVKSNAIVYARDGATVGIGAGQMSRVDSARIAARKATEAGAALDADGPSLAQGSVVASDAFFPFADGLLAAAEAGATAVIQPGGSVRDDEVIAAANEAGLAMVFTGRRHFRH